MPVMFWAPFFFVNLISEQLLVISFWRQCLWPSVYGSFLGITTMVIALGFWAFNWICCTLTCSSNVWAVLHLSISCTLACIFSCDLSPLFVNDLLLSLQLNILQRGLSTAWVLFWFVARFLSLFLSSSSFFCLDSSVLTPIKGLCLRQWLTSVKAESCYSSYTHLRGLVRFMNSSVTYIHQGGILLLSLLAYTLISSCRWLH